MNDETFVRESLVLGGGAIVESAPLGKKNVKKVTPLSKNGSINNDK